MVPAPRRHLRVGARVTSHGVELLADDDPWASYARTVLVIARPGLANLVVRATPAGETGRWPLASDDPLHVLTAWDPGAARPGEEENRARQAELEKELGSLGPTEMWTAVGTDSTSDHREEGVLVSGLALEDLLPVGARYGQDAIFEWTPVEWAIVACRGGRRAVFGWALGPA
jgi:hypothetical protein